MMPDDDDVLGFTLSNKLFTQNAWHEGYFAKKKKYFYRINFFLLIIYCKIMFIFYHLHPLFHSLFFFIYFWLQRRARNENWVNGGKNSGKKYKKLIKRSLSLKVNLIYCIFYDLCNKCDFNKGKQQECGGGGGVEREDHAM